MYSLALEGIFQKVKNTISFHQYLQVDVFLCLLVNSFKKRASFDNARLGV